MSQARNVFQAIGRTAHEVQGISQMISCIKAQADEGVDFDLAKVKRAIKRQRPWFQDLLDIFYCFVTAKGGGINGTEWQKFVVKHTAFVTPSLRSMPGEMFRVLVDFPWAKLAYAILLTAYTCPKGSVKGKVCTWIDDKQVERLGLTKDVAEIAKLESANKFLAQVALDLEDFPEVAAVGIWEGVAAEVRSSKATEQAKTLIAGQIDCAVGCWVLKKIKITAGQSDVNLGKTKKANHPNSAAVAGGGEEPDEEDAVRAATQIKFNDLGDIGRCYANLIHAAIPTCNLTTLRARYPIAAAVTGELVRTWVLPPPSSKLETLIFDSAGSTVNVLAHVHRAGFDIGQKVCLRNGCEAWTILAAVDCDVPR